MNYELVKELKEAGFPLRPFGEEELGHTEDPDDCPFYIPSEEFEDGTVYYIPTISELIEACGDVFSSLEKVDGYWNAIRDNGFQVAGATPEEAVANLYLGLNPLSTP